MSRSSRLLTALCLALAAMAVAAPLAGAAVGQPVTSGPNYDRNATVVQDHGITYLFFARSEQPCNRLDGCNPDNAKYDLWFKKSYDGGDHYGPATLAAQNPEPATDFRGRTLAAVNDGAR